MADTTKLEPKEATRGFLTVVIGEETLSGQRTSAGTVLDACDGLAGKVAADYCGNRVATISFASVYISGPILHADLVRMEGSVIRVGSSSMLVEVRVYKWDLQTRTYAPVQYALITMVQLTEDLKPKKGLPPLASLDDTAAAFVGARAEADAALKTKIAELKAAAAEGTLTVESVLDMDVDPEGKHVLERLTMEEGTMFYRTSFMPKEINTNKTIFGGHLLSWMEGAARTTAKVFSRIAHVYVIGMSDMIFRTPIFVGDFVEAKCTVVYVRKHALVIDVSVSVQRASDGSTLHSHSGTFTVCTLDPSGFRAKIPVQLDLEGASQDELFAYAAAKVSYEHWVLDPEFEHARVPENYNAPWPITPIKPFQP